MEKNKKNGYLADLGLLFVALIWGSGFVFMKNTLETVPPMMIMTLRFGIAAILAAIVFRKNLKNISVDTVKAGCVIGFFLFTAFATQSVGLQYINAGKQAFLTATNVIIVPFIYWLVKREQPDRYNFIAAFIMLIGIALLTTDFGAGFSFSTGDVLTLICAVLFACHIVSVGILTKKHDPLALTVIQLAFTAVFSLLSTLVLGDFSLDLPSESIFSTLYLGVFCSFLCFLLQTVSQKYTTSTHAAIIMSMESVFGSIFSIIFLGDRFTPMMIVGCLIIFFGIITAETKWSFLKKDQTAPLQK